MPGIAGELFRPFALTVTCSVLVSLAISFTLDPMLSAYWGDPADHHSKPKTGLSAYLERFNLWFDHQSDRYSKLIAWALQHRRSMGAIAVLSLVAAIALQVTAGGTSFMPATDSGKINITVRTPPSSSIEYAKLKIERAAEMVRQVAEVKQTDSTINVNGGRIYVDIGKRTERKRSAKEIAVELRENSNHWSVQNTM